jgi:hypothetical protein
MKLSQMKSLLAANAEKSLTFVLPDGEVIPGHYHITEVGHVSKRFIDCGGTTRTRESCQLQLWLGNDPEHRLTAGKAAAILDLGESILPADDLETEVEYEDCSISQYAVTDVRVEAAAVAVLLASKHTDCLAKVACGIDRLEDSCCSGKSGCC